MSRDHVEAIRAVYERWAEGDLRASVDLLDPHVVMVNEPEFEVGEPLFGIDAVVAYTREMLQAWTEFTIEATEVIPAGDTVIVGVHQRAVGRGSGVATELDYFWVWTFRGPKVVRFESFRDRAGALGAVGLPDRPEGG